MLTKEDLNNIKNLIEQTVYKIVRPMFKEQNEYIDRCFQNQAELIKQTYVPRAEYEDYKSNLKNAILSVNEKPKRAYKKSKKE